MSGKLTAAATNEEIVECLNRLVDKVDSHTAEEGAILASAFAAEFRTHVDVHHSPILEALFGKAKTVIDGVVVEREDDGIVDQIGSFTAQSKNGGIPSRLSTADKVKIISAAIASAPLLGLVQSVWTAVFGG